MITEDVCIKWSADHVNRIRVGLVADQSVSPQILGICSVSSFCIRDPKIKGIFEKEGKCEPEDALKKLELEAIAKGDFVFRIVHGYHSAHSFRFAERYCLGRKSFDSWLAGVIVVHREAFRRETGMIPLRTVVKSWLSEQARWIEAYLNGWLYGWVFEDEETYEDSLENFLSPDEALSDAVQCHPECVHDEGEFERYAAYRLASDPAGAFGVFAVPRYGRPRRVGSVKQLVGDEK